MKGVIEAQIYDAKQQNSRLNVLLKLGLERIAANGVLVDREISKQEDVKGEEIEKLGDFPHVKVDE